MRLRRARLEAEVREQVLADQMRRLAQRGADAEVDARLAEVDRVELRVAVGEVQQADVAEARQVVQRAALARQRVAPVEREPSGRRGGEHAEEFSSVQAGRLDTGPASGSWERGLSPKERGGTRSVTAW